MVDITRLPTQMARISNGTSNGTTVGGTQSSAPQGYSFAQEVQRRANVQGDGESPQNQASLSRLKRILDSGQPLRGDVPRGFYLDLKI